MFFQLYLAFSFRLYYIYIFVVIFNLIVNSYVCLWVLFFLIYTNKDPLLVDSFSCYNSCCMPGSLVHADEDALCDISRFIDNVYKKLGQYYRTQ